MAYIKLTLSLREKIEELLSKNVTIPEIAKETNISKVSIYEELARNLSRKEYKARRYEKYSAADAQKRAEKEAIEKLRK